jgi:osmotically inducible protein OsmC
LKLCLFYPRNPERRITIKTGAARAYWKGNLLTGSGNVILNSDPSKNFKFKALSQTKDPKVSSTPTDILAGAISTDIATILANEVVALECYPRQLQVEVEVDTNPMFAISEIRVVIRGEVPGLDSTEFIEAVNFAKEKSMLSTISPTIPVKIKVESVEFQFKQTAKNIFPSLKSRLKSITLKSYKLPFLAILILAIMVGPGQVRSGSDAYDSSVSVLNSVKSIVIKPNPIIQLKNMRTHTSKVCGLKYSSNELTDLTNSACSNFETLKWKVRNSTFSELANFRRCKSNAEYLRKLKIAHPEFLVLLKSKDGKGNSRESFCALANL